MSNQPIEPDFNFFNPKDYLHEYYSSLGKENNAILHFYTKAYSDLSIDHVLEFGGGPTIYQLITASMYADEIHFADYLEKNITEVRLWLQNDKLAFNWDIFIEKALEFEGINVPTQNQIEDRKKIIKKKISQLFQCNAFSRNSLQGKGLSSYDVVSSNFVAESISKTADEWESALENICSLVKPKGYLIITAILGATYWRAGEKIFPAVSITENTLVEKLIKNGFLKKDMLIESVEADTINETGKGTQGYDGLIFIRARKI